MKYMKKFVTNYVEAVAECYQIKNQMYSSQGVHNGYGKTTLREKIILIYL